MTVSILTGDCRAVLRTLPDSYFDVVVTSPPYWGLRDYGVEGQLGLERTLGEHLDVMVDIFREVRRVLKHQGTVWLNYGDCYATKPNGKSAAEYKADGTDDRAHRDKPFSTAGALYDPNHKKPRGPFSSGDRQAHVEHGGRVVAIGGKRVTSLTQRTDVDVGGWGASDDSLRWRGGGLLKPKDLCMIANRLAIALQDDGWYVRAEIIWHKPNPMPESIYDRPTVAHEKVWFLSKNEDYFYDHAAIREPVTGRTHARVARMKVPGGWDIGEGAHGTIHRGGRTAATYANMTPGVTPKSAPEDSNIRAKGSFHASTTGIVEDRNARNVWTIPSAPFDGEFCLACRSYFSGKGKRALRVETFKDKKGREERRRYCTCGCYDRWLSHFATFPVALAERCIKAGAPVTACHLCGEAKTAEQCGGICVGQARDPGRVLDPFGGAGTVGVVAQRLGLDATLIELNPDYAEMARCRIDGGAPPAIITEAAE